MDKISIVVLNYNNPGDTINCVNSILRNVSHNCSIVIVDNFSTDNSIEIIESSFKNFERDYVKIQEDDINNLFVPDSKISLILAKSNYGYARGNNLGIKYAFQIKSKYIVILNNDVIVVDDFLCPLIDEACAVGAFGILSPIIYKDTSKSIIDNNCARNKPKLYHFICLSLIGKLFLKKLPLLNSYFIRINNDCDTTRIPIYMGSGACLLFSYDTLKKIDLFDESTFLFYEEAIIAEKLIREGLKSYLIKSASVIHPGGGTIKKTPSINILKYELNSLRYYLTEYRKYSKLFIFIATLGHNISILLIKTKYYLR